MHCPNSPIASLNIPNFRENVQQWCHNMLKAKLDGVSYELPDPLFISEQDTSTVRWMLNLVFTEMIDDMLQEFK